MQRATVDPSVGRSMSEDVGRHWHAGTYSWTSKDALLYALSVGAGGGDPQFSTENTEGIAQQVLPTFAVLMQNGEADLSPLRPHLSDVLHAEQFVEVLQPLRTSGTVRVESRIVDVFDKGRDAQLVTETTAFDAADERIVALMRSSVFIAGAGGFGGPRGVSAPWERPSRSPDHSLQFRVPDSLALLYRLNGDRNPLHSDPSVAARAGFRRPILHGLCTFGIAVRMLLAATTDGDVSGFRSCAARFTRPVVPGDVLDLTAWMNGAEALFRVAVDGDVVLDRGRLCLAS